MKKDIQVFLYATTTSDKKFKSVACVSEDGQEFYAEISDIYFTGGNASMTEAQFATRLQEWIDQLSCHDKKVIQRVILNVDEYFDWDIQKFFDNFGSLPKGLKYLYRLRYHDNHRTHLFKKERSNACFKIESLNLPYALKNARGLLAAWKKVETCKETKEVFDGSKNINGIVHSVVHSNKENCWIGFCKLCGNIWKKK